MEGVSQSLMFAVGFGWDGSAADKAEKEALKKQKEQLLREHAEQTEALEGKLEKEKESQMQELQESLSRWVDGG